jgi:F-type H+-transporting ATPase subunit gamma
MAQLREIRRRIKSIGKTQQVTRAMKMVAAARLRRAQDSILHARPYANKLVQVIQDLLASQDLPPHPLLSEKTSDCVHLIVLSGDRGLCGSFNYTVFREVENFESGYPGSLELTVIGKKGIDYFKKRKYSICSASPNPDRKSIAAFSQRLSESIAQRFIEGKCSRVGVTYMEFKSALTQRVITEWMLPLNFTPASETKYNLDFIFHPNALEILNQVLPRFLTSQIYRAILESQASELGARMTAMESATRNSEDMITQLTLSYNQARQAAITKELIEIVSGAEALHG